MPQTLNISKEKHGVRLSMYVSLHHGSRIRESCCHMYFHIVFTYISRCSPSAGISLGYLESYSANNATFLVYQLLTLSSTKIRAANIMSTPLKVHCEAMAGSKRNLLTLGRL